MFRIEFSSRAIKEYNKLDATYQQSVNEVLKALKVDPVPARLFDVKKLKGFRDTFRIRIGKVRIVYIIIWKDKAIIVSRISFREGAYD